MDYEKEVMRIAYEIISDGEFSWRKDFNYDMKMELLKLLIEYFTDIEHYEKCSNLSKMIKGLEKTNENISKTTVTGSEES
tara:strand:+ start:128 stop:367 length:240 start_codon:yes stop_codon:yes gene_type:complete